MSQISEYQSRFWKLNFFGNAKTFWTVPKTTYHNWRSPSETCTKSFDIHKMKLDLQSIDWEFIWFEHYCKETFRKN